MASAEQRESEEMSAVRPDLGNLAVTLQHHEGVSIGPDIEVRMVRVIHDSQHVRLLIVAPKNVEISRFKWLKAPQPVAAVNKPMNDLEETLRMVRAAAE